MGPYKAGQGPGGPREPKSQHILSSYYRHIHVTSFNPRSLRPLSLVETRTSGSGGDMSTALGHSAHKQHSSDHCICGGTTACQQWGPSPLAPELVPSSELSSSWRRPCSALSSSPGEEMTQFLLSQTQVTPAPHTPHMGPEGRVAAGIVCPHKDNGSQPQMWPRPRPQLYPPPSPGLGYLPSRLWQIPLEQTRRGRASVLRNWGRHA